MVTGRAKGLPPFKLLLKYPLRMALNPFIADIGNMLPQIISGAADRVGGAVAADHRPMLLARCRARTCTWPGRS